jgi:hypothetical protein
MTAGKAKQALIASRVGGHDQPPEQAADRRNSGRGQGVAVGVDADDAVHRLASMAMNALPPRSTLWSAWRNTARRTCDESQPSGLDRLLYQARNGGARPTSAPSRRLVTKAASLAPDPSRVMPRCADAEA